MIKLQACNQCQTIHYPERDICPSCLSEALVWKAVSGEGTLTSITKLHISTKSDWQERLPLNIGLIKLGIGPKILAFLAPGLVIGNTVVLTQDGDIFTAQNKDVK